MNELPPLPPHPRDSWGLWDADEKRVIEDYARACERAAYERVVRICEQNIRRDKHGYPSSSTSILEDVVAEIRALGADK